ncbi:MAG: hypothetical protein RIB43_01250 [Rhodospirillaceae bacterium]
MTQTNEKTTHTHIKHHGRSLLLAAVALLFGATLVLWGWNTVAADLLGAPPAKFVHAVALEALVAGLLIAVLLPFKVINQTPSA